jgi:hypothetical protein
LAPVNDIRLSSPLLVTAITVVLLAKVGSMPGVAPSFGPCKHHTHVPSGATTSICPVRASRNPSPRPLGENDGALGVPHNDRIMQMRAA